MTQKDGSTHGGRCPSCDHSKWALGQCAVVYGNDGPCNCSHEFHWQEDARR